MQNINSFHFSNSHNVYRNVENIFALFESEDVDVMCGKTLLAMATHVNSVDKISKILRNG